MDELPEVPTAIGTITRRAYHQMYAIMHTCWQIQWEFAQAMYARPPQFQETKQGSTIIPISPRYASLVRQLVIIHPDFRNWANSTSTLASDIWHYILQTATELIRIFPQLRKLRVMHVLRSYNGD